MYENKISTLMSEANLATANAQQTASKLEDGAVAGTVM
jgi:hypothetical protein